MKACRGFSLVELMVAMMVGLVIILGAGQLLLTVFQTSRQVRLLSEKQAAITFLAVELTGEVRRGEFDGKGYRLARVRKDEDLAVIEKKDSAGSFQALVGGLLMPEDETGDKVLFEDSRIVSKNDGVARIEFYLEAGDKGRETIVFVVAGRTEAVAEK